jgi:hypothetical protein
MQERNNMRTLIWQQLHLRIPEQGKLWAVNQKLIRRLNPEADILVIDNASPLDPLSFLEGQSWSLVRLEPMDEWVPDMTGRRNVMVRFHEALGHFFYDRDRIPPPKDGPGRAHALALQMAFKARYERGVYIEADALYRHPVQWGFDRLTKPVGCQPLTVYGYLDWHVWWNDLRWLKEFDFVGKYDWQNRVGEPGGERPGEHIYADILGDHLEVRPCTGVRGDSVAMTVDNMASIFPEGMDYLTHVRLDCFARWLSDNGHADLAAELLQ